MEQNLIVLNSDELAAKARDQVKNAILCGESVNLTDLANSLPEEVQEDFWEAVDFYKNYGIVFFEWCRRNSI